MLRDRLRARLDQMGADVDHVRLAEEMLGIRNAPPALARKLVSEALIVGERREVWAKAGRRICESAPPLPGVYVLRDEAGSVLYVGKAVSLKRRLSAHFAPKRWLQLRPDMARVTDAAWQLVGSELEALLVEAEWIRTLSPRVNVQIGPPSMKERAVPLALVQDLVVVLPAADAEAVTLIGARSDGPVKVERAVRDGSQLSKQVHRLWRFFMQRLTSSRPPKSMPSSAPLVFSWLAGRGMAATRLEVRDLESAADLESRLGALLGASELFQERIVLRRGP